MAKVKRSLSVKQRAKDKSLLLLIEGIKLEHPFWGYRRIWAWLKYHNGYAINRKRVQRLLQLHKLGVKRSELKAKRTATRSKPQATNPNEFWGIDMTKTITKFGWVYIVLVVDWYSKKIVGYEIDNRSKTMHWKRALNMGLNNCFEDGVRDKGLHLVSDNGSQPTSTSFIQECGNLDIEQIYTSYNNPKGNAETERMMRTMKEECLWLCEFETLTEVQNAVTYWIEWYNDNYLHSTLKYKTPNSVHGLHKQNLTYTTKICA